MTGADASEADDGLPDSRFQTQTQDADDGKEMTAHQDFYFITASRRFF